jgi:phenylacetate-CoA ligase
LATPFLRFKTGDRGVLGKEKCVHCGRNFRLISKIVGRNQDVFISKTGRALPLSAINVHSDIFDQVWTYQFYQVEAGVLELRIVRKPSFGDRDIKKILEFIDEKFGAGFQVTIKFVDKIETTARGKSQFIIQNINLADVADSCRTVRRL